MVILGAPIISLRQLTLLLCALLSLSACPKSPAPPLRVGANLWPGYDLLFLAREKGWLPKDAVRLVEFPSSSDVISALENGSLEGAMLTLDEVLLLRAHGHPFQVAAVLDTSNGGDVILARPPLSSLADLAGHRVGVEGGALGAYMLSRALSLHGVDLASIQTVPLTVGEHLHAYNDGRVDAVVTFEPVRSQLLAAGAHELFSSKEIPDEIVDVLVFHKDAARARPEAIAATLDAHFRARALLLQAPDKAAPLLATHTHLSPQATLATYNGLKLPSREENLRLLSGPNPPLKQTAARLTKTLLEQKLLHVAPPLRDLLLPAPRAGAAP